jgi:hypothetical protein
MFKFQLLRDFRRGAKKVEEAEQKNSESRQAKKGEKGRVIDCKLLFKGGLL